LILVEIVDILEKYMATIPSPAELGIDLPSWRSGQEQMIDVTVTSDKRAIAVCAPTGFGKSAAVIASSIIVGEPTCIVTQSRGLQDQYVKEFGHLGLVDIRGKKNYECSTNPEFNCEEGQAAGCPNKGTHRCPSSAAEMRASTSSLVVTNYAKWCASRKYGQGMSHFTRVVFDEGHSSFDALCEAMQVTINYKETAEKLKLDFPKLADDMQQWKEWAAAARVVAESEMLRAKTRIEGLSNPKPAWVRNFTHLRNLSRRLCVLSTARAKDWVVEQTNMGYQFDPIRPGRYAESALLLRIPKLVFVSATIRPKTMFMVGVPSKDFDFIEFDSDFDPQRCPIYYIPTMRVDARNSDKSMLWAMLDRWLSRRTDRKGIIQTTSYDYQQAIQSVSRFRDKMILIVKG
jgi:Rad3-related DNA helicase